MVSPYFFLKKIWRPFLVIAFGKWSPFQLSSRHHCHLSTSFIQCSFKIQPQKNLVGCYPCPAWLTPFLITVSVRPDQWCLFCTLSLSVFYTHYNQLDSNLANLEAVVDVDKFLSFFTYNNSVVARAWWAFQVSQGSVETLFARNGKRLHTFSAHLFRTPCTKFHQNRRNFIEDITKKTFWSLFFWTQCRKCWLFYQLPVN